MKLLAILLSVAAFGCPTTPDYRQEWYQQRETAIAIQQQTINQSLDAIAARPNPFDSYIPVP